MYVISPVRNPLGNFEAWQRYTTKRGNLPHDPHQTVRSFLDAWAAHHEYWANVGLPLTVYRYEDLIEDPVGVLVKTLRASGLWDHCGVRDIDLLYAVIDFYVLCTILALRRAGSAGSIWTIQVCGEHIKFAFLPSEASRILHVEERRYLARVHHF